MPRNNCYPLLALGLALIFIPLEAQAQDESEWTPGVYMEQATSNTFEKASLMNALSEFSWSDNLCMAGALLEIGETIALDVELESGTSYTFIGGGDEDITDLDMYIVDQNGEVVASDIEDDDTPIPDFTAAYSGRYSVRMQLVSGEAPTSFVSFAMLTEDGTTIEEEAYGDLSDNFYASGGNINDLSTGIRWHDTDNQWCMFGMLLASGDSWEIENMYLGSENHYVFAYSGEEAQNVDMVLVDENGKEVDTDTDDDTYPILEGSTSEDHRYTLKVSNVKSRGRTFIMVGVVTE